MVDVGCDAVVSVIANRRRKRPLLGKPGLLADLIDHATGLAAAEQHRRGTAQHLDLLQVEGLAVVLRDVANPVQVQVTHRRIAAQGDVVADARGEAPNVFVAVRRDPEMVHAVRQRAAFVAIGAQ